MNAAQSDWESFLKSFQDNINLEFINENFFSRVIFQLMACAFKSFGWTFLFFFLYFMVYSHFIKNNVITAAMPFPLLGNNFFVFFGFRNPFDNTRMIYNQGKKTNLGVAGWFDLITPVLSLCDYRIVKSVIIGLNSLNHFGDHREVTTPKDFNIRNLFQLKGEDWKKMRKFLALTFSDVELAKLLKLMIPITKNLDTYLLEQYEIRKREKEIESNRTLNDGEFTMEIDVKDVFSRFANDCILTIAFGFEQNSFSEDIKANETFKHGQNLTNVLTGFRWLKYFLINFSYGITEWFFPGGMYEQKSQEFLLKIFNEQLELRKKGDVRRDDVLQLMVDNIDREDLTQDDICAHALLFFFAGFDSIATSLSMVALQLAEHQLAQEKVFQEMNRCDIYNKHEKDRSFYDILAKLPYMDSVITESLRRYPIIVELDRVCTQEFTFHSEDGQSQYKIHKGQRINVPVFGFHQDTRYFTQPKLFLPDRWIDKNNRYRESPQFLAFGAGRRKCIGFRFARMEMKLALSSLLRHFQIIPIDATPLPMKLKNTFEISPQPNGFIVGFRKRTSHDTVEKIFYPTIITNIDLMEYKEVIQLKKRQEEAEKRICSQQKDQSEKIAILTTDEQRVPVQIKEQTPARDENQNVPENKKRSLDQTCGESLRDDEDTEDASEGEEKKLSTAENEKKSDQDSEDIVASGEDEKIHTEKKNEEKTDSLTTEQTESLKSDQDSEGKEPSGEDQKIPTEKKNEEKTESITTEQTESLKSDQDSEGIVPSGEDQKIPTEKKNEEKTERLTTQQTDFVTSSKKDSCESQTQKKKSDPNSEGEVASGVKPEISGTPRRNKNLKLSEAKSEKSPKVPLEKSKVQSPIVPSPHDRRWKNTK